MKAYIGTKVVLAEPMKESKWLEEKRGVKTDRGFIEQCDKDGYKVVYEDGYTSWCPKDVFERSYREVTSSEKALIK